KALMIIYHDVNNDTKEVIKQLYFNGSSFKETAEIINAKEKRVIIQHNYIVDEVLDILGFDITNKNKYKSRKDRYIPLNVKREVFERDGGKCQSCDSENNLHHHHIKRYSNGGVNKAYNLILLCSSCHANEHRGETAYNLLK